MFKPPAPALSDGYKLGHKDMLAPGVEYLYGTYIPRSFKHAPKGTEEVIVFGHRMAIRHLHDTWQESFFNQPIEVAEEFVKDMTRYLGMPYDGDHFISLHKLGYLPIKVKALDEGISTDKNIPHATIINTHKDFPWLTLFLETTYSLLSWKATTAINISKQFKNNAVEWTLKTDKDNLWLADYMCHDFSARGLSGSYDLTSVSLAHAACHIGSDSLMAIYAARYYYGVSKDEVIVNSVNASEHSVTCTGIFYFEDKLRSGELNERIKEYYSYDVPCEGSVEEPDYRAIAEWLNIERWLMLFPEGILSIVSDTFDLWKLITHILPRLKKQIMSREGKVVIRPDSGYPPDIICGINEIKDLTTLINLPNGIYFYKDKTFSFKRDEWLDIISDYDKEIFLEEALQTYLKNENLEGFKKWNGNKVIYFYENNQSINKGVVELLDEIFGSTVNAQGYKVLDSHIGCIYGDAINLDRQVEIYSRLEQKGYAATNVVLGIGSYTYEYLTRDTYGIAVKASWFCTNSKDYNIYKDPITDGGVKKSLKGFQMVYKDENGKLQVKSECSMQEEEQGELKVIYRNGKFFNEMHFQKIRDNVNNN